MSYFARLLGSYRLLPRAFASDDLAFKEFSLSLLHSRKVASLFIDKMTSNSTLKPTRHVKYYWFHIPISEFWMQPERLFCLVCLLGSHKTLYCIYSQCSWDNTSIKRNCIGLLPFSLQPISFLYICKGRKISE